MIVFPLFIDTCKGINARETPEGRERGRGINCWRGEGGRHLHYGNLLSGAPAGVSVVDQSFRRPQHRMEKNSTKAARVGRVDSGHHLVVVVLIVVLVVVFRNGSTGGGDNGGSVVKFTIGGGSGALPQ